MDTTGLSKYTAPTDQILAAHAGTSPDYATIAAYPEFAHADLETVEELLREAGNLTEARSPRSTAVGDQIGAKYDPADHEL